MILGTSSILFQDIIDKIQFKPERKKKDISFQHGHSKFYVILNFTLITRTWAFYLSKV